jgi:hypothetical protein
MKRTSAGQSAIQISDGLKPLSDRGGGCLLAVMAFAAFSVQSAQAQSQMILGRLSTGAAVAFVRDAGGWGMDIGGMNAPHILQHRPARLDIYTAGKPQELAAGYASVRTSQGGMVARADISFGTQVTFHVEDHWRIKAGTLWVHRHVTVSGDAEGGFGSEVLFSTTPNVGWSGMKFLAPSKLYSDPTFDGATAPGSPLHDEAKRFSIREMALTAPLFALNFSDGYSITVLDPTPKGETTADEAGAPTDTVMMDARYNFGALGAHQGDDGVVFGYWLPGTVNDFLNLGRTGPSQPPGTSPGAPPAALTAQGALAPAARPNVQPAWRRRYNPIQDGMVQDYDVAFRFGQNETFAQTTRNAWRWAWSILKPAVNYVDLDGVRRMSIDVLSSQVLTVEGRTGIPYLLDAHTGQFRNRSDAKRAAMGFCARNIEIADEFLKEADRDPGTARSERLRRQGLDIIATFVRLLPMSPPDGDGFDLFTGKIIPASWSVGQQPLLTISTDMRSLVLAYEREKKKGIEHREWLAWAKTYADWLLTQQHDDGSFPRAWKPGTNTVFNNSPSASYAPVVLFVPLAGVTGERKYMDAARRAGDFLWRKYGTAGNYQGGAVDASSAQLLTDKEGGMASLDAFMALYEATRQSQWLSRALSAADYTESWIWIWNVPLPGHVPDAHLRWRNGSMVGLQEITANGPGLGASGDEYLDWAVSLYAKAYKYSGDAHYLDVARILLHNTKAKIATSRDAFDFVGPGWEQESWSGDPGKWLPWLAANHLNGIMTLQELDPALYRKLAEKPH